MEEEPVGGSVPTLSPGVCWKPLINIHGAEGTQQHTAAAEAKQALHQNLDFTTAGCLCWELRAAPAWECRGATHDGAGVDVVRAALAVLHLQGDPGVIVCNTNGDFKGGTWICRLVRPLRLACARRHQ